MKSRWLLVTALMLSLAGVGLAIVLVQEHLTVYGGGLAQGLLCGGGGRLDCNRVAGHESSWMLGLPLALWGLLFYIVVLGVSLFALGSREDRRSTPIRAAALLALAAVVFDLYLAYVMVSEIGALCLNCVATYGINLLLAAIFLSMTLRPAPAPAVPVPAPDAGDAGPTARRSPTLKIVAVAVTVLGVALAVFETWRPLKDIAHGAREEAITFLLKMDEPPEIDMARFEGRPSRGPAAAPIVIAVVGDFQCSYCRVLASNLEHLARENPRMMRVLFVHQPLNTDCNPMIPEDIHGDACWLAEVGACAAEQGKFWDYHDYLFERLPMPLVRRGPVTDRLHEIGLDIDSLRTCLDSGAAGAAVAADVELCKELKLNAVPAIVINGYVEKGGVYPGALKSIVHVLVERYRQTGHATRAAASAR